MSVVCISFLYFVLLFSSAVSVAQINHFKLHFTGCLTHRLSVRVGVKRSIYSSRSAVATKAEFRGLFAVEKMQFHDKRNYRLSRHKQKYIHT